MKCDDSNPLPSATAANTGLPKPGGDGTSKEVANSRNQAVLDSMNSFKKQFATMQVHLEGFMFKLMGSRTTAQPCAGNLLENSIVSEDPHR